MMVDWNQSGPIAAIPAGAPAPGWLLSKGAFFVEVIHLPGAVRSGFPRMHSLMNRTHARIIKKAKRAIPYNLNLPQNR
jgi:hypothetical protein